MEELVRELAARVKLLEERCERLEAAVAKGKKSKLPDSRVSEIRKAFTEGYLAKFGHEYHWGAKENGMAAAWIRTVPVDRAVWLINWFLVWTDTWITQRGHPFGDLVGSVVKLEAQLNRGGRYFKAVVASKVAHEERERDLEVLGHVERRSEKTRSAQIGFGDVGELQNKANTPIHGQSAIPLGAGVRPEPDGESVPPAPIKIRQFPKPSGSV